MIQVIGVRFKKAGKAYYFDPNGFEIEPGSPVIVETARGLEYGYAADGVIEVEDDEIVQPLRQVIRIATEEDALQNEANLTKKEQSMKICQEKIEKHGLEMKLIDCERTFDNSKIIFYFSADGRVDFRELVKDLASVFRTRIELRQIGVRDEAKMLGGIGPCGRPLCCHQWLPDFEPVSIKMAKVQNLSLNPTKISGICGRLMCCLKYENDVYAELHKGMPEPGERVKTIDGLGVVWETNILENRIKVRLILEEKTKDSPEKLSNDYYIYGKEQIQRLGRKGREERKPDEERVDPEIEKMLGD